MPAAEGRIRLDNSLLLAYGLPAVPLAALGIPLYLYLPPFYAEEIGLGLSTVGGILLLARLWDMAIDPVIGQLSDTVSTPFGRRRPWLIVAGPLVMISVWRLLVPDEGAGPAYLLGWTMALYLSWTLVLLPYTAWGAELSGDYHDRSRVAAWREGGVILGTLAAAALPALIADGGGSQRPVLEALAWTIIVLLPVTLAVLLWRVPEPRAAAPRRLGWRRGWRLLARNTPFLRLLAAYLLNGLANGLPATLFLLFVGDVIDRPAAAGVLLLVYFLCGIAAVPAWLKLSYRYGKHRSWAIAMAWASLAFLGVPWLGPGDVYAFGLVCVLTGIALGADMTLPAAIQADVIDLDTLRGGRQRTALYFALWSMATKLALALAVGIAYPLLDLTGYQPGGTNDSDALWVLTALYCLAPVAFKVAAITLVWNFPLDQARQAKIRRRLETRPARGSEVHP